MSKTAQSLPSWSLGSSWRRQRSTNKLSLRQDWRQEEKGRGQGCAISDRGHPDQVSFEQRLAGSED